MYRVFVLSLLCFSTLVAETPNIDKRHVLYLMSVHEVEKAIDTYLKIYRTEKKHDFEVLEQMCLTLLEMGSSSPSREDQLLTLFGIALSQSSRSFLSFLNTAMKSPFPEVQGAALQILSQTYEDKSTDIISLGLKSSFLQIRFETLFHLIQRKTHNSLGQIESLMNLLPPQAKPFFIEFYAIHGSSEAISILKQCMNDLDYHVRISSILHAARYGRDDLLPNIRSALTQSDPFVKESASFAVGYLGDLHSIEQLKTLCSSTFVETKLAALFALFKLGHTETKTEIFKLAEGGNLFAIYLLGEIPDSAPILEKLLVDKDPTIALNATIALLHLKNPKALPFLLDLLETNLNVSCFTPITSPGKAFLAWKKVMPASFKTEELKNQAKALSLRFQEELLARSLELPSKDFLHIAKALMQSRETKLLPLLIRLLENEASDDVKTLLVEKAYAIDNPLVRSYCKLALYRMHINAFYRGEFLKWLAHQKATKMIEFRPMLEGDGREGKQKGEYALSPEEVSGLFVESFNALADNHDPEGIEFLLESLRDGHPKNRYAFAGLLLKSIY